MRVFLLFLLLVVCVNAGLFDNFGEKIKNALSKIKTTLNKSNLIKIREKIHALKNKIVAKLTLTPEQKAALAKRLKELVTIKKDHVSPKGDSIEEVNAKSHIGDLLYQSDMVLTQDQADELVAEEEGRPKRQAFRDRRYPQTLWSSGVAYFFHPNATPEVKSVFKKGAAWWSKDTCIDFYESAQGTKVVKLCVLCAPREDNVSAKDRIRVFKEDGCWSYVGRLGNQQDLSLGSGCESIGTAAHEIGHALGMFHTHSRHDRDSFITLNTQNIKPDWLDQFKKETTATNDNYGITYDYGSIMHYGAQSATVNKKPTMVPHDTNYIETLGSPFISFYELLMMNKHYGCLDKCKSTPNQCKMGGFPHPRDCSKCICPRGYGGRFCDQKSNDENDFYDIDGLTSPIKNHQFLPSAR
ncbi:astacin [Ancylostoma caninum]|uniref:Zinc metalloproteinase n=1 Tax=Ancylostoma caninum TaxID=29170 RepID=A0A368GYA7_ANCCA|nr:astacin [Ancylostoma caninum]